MTVYTELPNALNANGDEFAPVDDLAVGDEFLGEIGREFFAVAPDDQEDIISVLLEEGKTYSFDLTKVGYEGATASLAVQLGLAVSVGGADVAVVEEVQDVAVTTYTFIAQQSAYFDISIAGYSIYFITGPDGGPLGVVGSTNYALTLVTNEPTPTAYVEQPIPGVPLGETFGPPVDPVVGDTWSGTLGQVPTGGFDLGDAFNINVVAGQTYSFTVNLDRSDNGAFFMQTTTAEGLIQVEAPLGVTTIEFSFTATETGVQEVGIASTSTTALYTVALNSISEVGPTDGNDVLLGGDAPTTLNLLDGDDIWTGVSETETFVNGMYTDTINGGNGNDSIYGGIGNDKLGGGRDDDLLDLGDGNDNAWGGEGDDVIYGGTGLDRINGNSGHDELYGGKGGDIMRGGKGEDLIYGGNQADKIWGGSQADEIYGGTGDDLIYGQEGFDLMFGGSGGDEIYGGTFNDTAFGGHGADKINGGSGDDELHGGESDDKLNGNTGEDVLFGGAGNDNLSGGKDDDVLFGGAQSDVLKGGNGEDTLYGGSGDDALFGGLGADTFVFEGTVNHDVISDFDTTEDTIDLTSYGPITLEYALSLISETGDGVVIDLKENGSILLEGVLLFEVNPSNIQFEIDLGDDVLEPPVLPEIIEVG